MTNEQRLDRMERIGKLFVKAGLRVRQQVHEHDDKINILINFQMQNEEKVARQGERISILQELNEERFARLAESQANTNRKLDSLIDLIREGRNGDASSKLN